MQVRASGTPLIPTRKIVDFLGIRAMEGGDGGLSTSLAASSYRSQVPASGKIPATLRWPLRQLVTASLSSGGESHEFVISLMEWPLALRSEERRVGKGGVSTCRSRWSTD